MALVNLVTQFKCVGLFRVSLCFQRNTVLWQTLGTTVIQCWNVNGGISLQLHKRYVLSELLHIGVWKNDNCYINCHFYVIKYYKLFVANFGYIFRKEFDNLAECPMSLALTKELRDNQQMNIYLRLKYLPWNNFFESLLVYSTSFMK